MSPQPLLVTVNPVVSKPFVKWVGGKRRVIPELLRSLPTTFEHYYEPFVGGGALFFHLRSMNLLQEHRITISDFNLRLIRTYRAIRDDVEAVIDRLRHHKIHHCFSVLVGQAGQLDTFRARRNQRAKQYLLLRYIQQQQHQQRQ